MRKVWSVGLLLLAVGCVSPREQLDHEVIAQVRAGESREHVHRMLGEPFAVVKAKDGGSADQYIYGSIVYSPRSGYKLEKDLRLRALVVIYDGQHRVKRTDLSETHVPSEVWSERKGFNQAFSGEIRKRIQPGLTKRDEMVALFGLPLIEGGHPAGGSELVWLDFYSDTGDLVRFPGREFRARLDDQGVVQEVSFNTDANRWPR